MKEYPFKITSRHATNYEDQKNFKESIFSDVYDKAFRITQKIIDINDDEWINPKDSFDKKNVYNIIPFMGGRGTGKTSAMLSYASFLKDYVYCAKKNNISYRYFTELRDHEKEKICSFTVLDLIDASLLESGEDIIEIIIANLFFSFKKLDEKNSELNFYKSSLRRDLYQKFESFYFNSKKINSRNDDKSINIATSIEQLHSLATSFNLRDELAEIVDMYLNFTRCDDIYNHSDNTHNFLVIPIDDIDMNIENCYYMLEQIRRYLMIPKVIILMSADYNQLIDICKTEYLKKFKICESVINEVIEKKCYNLAIEYLAKLIPDDIKIDLPDIMVNDYINRVRLYVDKSTLEKMYDYEWDDDKNISVHKLILYNIARAIHLYLPEHMDGGYIFEPNSIRILNSLLMGMKQLKHYL